MCLHIFGTSIVSIALIFAVQCIIITNLQVLLVQSTQCKSYEWCFTFHFYDIILMSTAEDYIFKQSDRERFKRAIALSLSHYIFRHEPKLRCWIEERRKWKEESENTSTKVRLISLLIQCKFLNTWDFTSIHWFTAKFKILTRLCCQYCRATECYTTWTLDYFSCCLLIVLLVFWCYSTSAWNQQSKCASSFDLQSII